jgi:hypothetical protein
MRLALFFSLAAAVFAIPMAKPEPDASASPEPQRGWYLWFEALLSGINIYTGSRGAGGGNIGLKILLLLQVQILTRFT